MKETRISVKHALRRVIKLAVVAKMTRNQPLYVYCKQFIQQYWYQRHNTTVVLMVPKVLHGKTCIK